MVSIAQVEIRNFQSHAHTVAAFAPSGQLTVITGASDQGKTAIFRAIRWALYNVPRGMEFMRVGAELVQVAVTFDDGTVVTRERRKSTNRYLLLLPDGTRHEYVGFGDGVPLEIKQATGVYPIQIGDMELPLHFAEQLDGPFLGAKATTGPARAKVLGKLAGAEVVDQATRMVNRDLHNAATQENRLQEEGDRLQRAVDAYHWLPAAETTLKCLTEIDGQATALQVRQESLSALRKHEKDIASRRGIAEDVMLRWADIPERVARATQGVELLSCRGSELSRIKTNMLRQQDLKHMAYETVGRTESLPTTESLVREAEAQINKGQLLSRLQEAFEETTTQHFRHETTLRALTQVLVAAERVDAAAKSNERRDRLARISAAMRQQHEAARRQRELLTLLSKLEEAETVLAGAAASNELTNQLRSKAREYASLKSMGGVLSQSVKQITQATALAERDYESTLREYGKCPLCGSKSLDHVSEVL